jgi:hypothetical protein
MQPESMQSKTDERLQEHKDRMHGRGLRGTMLLYHIYHWKKKQHLFKLKLMD